MNEENEEKKVDADDERLREIMERVLEDFKETFERLAKE